MAFRWFTLVVCLGLLALVVLPASAQLATDFLGDGPSLARSGTGVAAPVGPATGVLNPANLPILHGIPPARPVSDQRARAMGDPLQPAYAAAADRWLRQWRGTEHAWDFSFQDGDRLALGTTGPTLSLPGAALGLEPQQVQIETRFLTVGDTLNREIGVDWIAGTPGFLLNYSHDLGDTIDRDAVHVTGGGLGNNDAFSLSFTKLFDDNILSAAWGHLLTNPNRDLLSAPRVTASGSQRATISVGGSMTYVDSPTQSEVLFDVGGAANKLVGIGAMPVLLSAGLVGRNLTNEFSTSPWWERHFDLGVAADNGTVRLMVDVRDLFNQTNLISLPEITGRNVATSVEVRAGNTILIGGIREHERLSYGIEQRIPLLGDLPLAGSLFFSKSDERREIGLMIMITPRVLDAPEE